MENKAIRDYILEYARYDDEPLHLIAYAALEEKICNESIDLIESLLALKEQGAIRISFHDGQSGSPYKRVEGLDTQTLRDHLVKCQKLGLSRFPPSGEFFVKTL